MDRSAAAGPVRMSATGRWTELLRLSPRASGERRIIRGHGFLRRRLAPGLADPGFTLLEVLVVLFIVGIMFSFAVLRVGDQGSEQAVRREAERLRALLILAGERAVLEAREFSLSFSEEGYGFLVLEDDNWQLIEDDELFRVRELPEGIIFELTANELPVELATAVGEDEGPVPHVLILSSGELTPFQLTFYAEQGTAAYLVEGEYLGEIKLERSEAF